MTLNEAILSIVSNNSGGIKFTKLVSALVCMDAEIGGISHNYGDGFADLVEKRCKDMSEIKLLEYAMSEPERNPFLRNEPFVYFPLSKNCQLEPWQNFFYSTYSTTTEKESTNV